MTFIIRANNKDYIVSSHAAERMMQRFITEEMVIQTLENGTLTQQARGTDLYEHQIFDETLEEYVIVRVAVDEEAHLIVTVIDHT
jgi:hypothetical protein